MWHCEEREHLLIDHSGVSVKVFAADYHYLLSGEESQPVLKLVNIDASRQISSSLVSKTMIHAIAVRSFSPGPCSLLFLVERFCERERLMPPPDIVTILGVGALNWIAEQSDELDMREKPGH